MAKTLGEVIRETRERKAAKKVAWPKAKLFWVKSYNERMDGVVQGEVDGKIRYWAKDLFTCYGPFSTLKAADTFVRGTLHCYDEAIRQAEVASWRDEGNNFLKPTNALA